MKRNETFDGTIVGLFRLLGKTTARQFFIGQVRVKAFATYRMIGAPRICAGAAFLVHTLVGTWLFHFEISL